MKKTIIFLLISMIISASAFAGRGGFGGPQGPGGMHPERILRLAEDLGLSDDQVSQIEDIIYKSKKAVIQEEGKVKEIMLDIRHLMKNQDVDFRVVEEKVAQKTKMMAKLETERLRAMFEIRKVLSDEQFKELKKIIPQKMKKNKRGRGRFFRGDAEGPESCPEG